MDWNRFRALIPPIFRGVSGIFHSTFWSFFDQTNEKNSGISATHPLQKSDSEEGQMTDHKNDGRMKQYQVSVQISFATCTKPPLRPPHCFTFKTDSGFKRNPHLLPRAPLGRNAADGERRRRRWLTLGYGGGGGGGGVCVCGGSSSWRTAFAAAQPNRRSATSGHTAFFISLPALLHSSCRVVKLGEKWTSHVLHRR
jgi:hypothetical protein